jgi:asparagine synthase (glutamine-hydrolysing)
MSMGDFSTESLKELLCDDLHDHIPQNSNWFYEKFFDPSVDKPKRFQILDINCFMAELVLTKIDRASMANSLEVRVPFLNTKLSDLMLSLDPQVYFDEKKQKILLRTLLKKHVPRKIINRKKQGFTGPDSYYMNFEYYKNKLDKSFLVEDGIVKRNTIDRYLRENDHWRLWKVFVFEKWYSKWIKQYE